MALLFQNPALTSKKIHSGFITKTNLLLLLRKVITSCSEHHSKHVWATFRLLKGLSEIFIKYNLFTTNIKITGHIQLRAMLNGSHDPSGCRWKSAFR
jgi:hypothetical protein